ncbi:GNAT family N-acetyltransferase [Clostridium sp. LP20]|uniref:GNAT family N-acetyltransferase n=1 Tax=Clostridium sp. LP20 TaxID=3418665 RepID=UPI003EE45C44
MLDIQFDCKGYRFLSVKEEDLDELAKWIKENNKDDHTCYSLDSQIFYRRYLEYYVTDNESFIKIYKEDRLIAVFKGRVELEGKFQLFVWLFIMEESARNEGLGSEIIEIIIEYFIREYKIDTIEVGVVGNNLEGISFWSSRNFQVARVSKDFFEDREAKERDLVIMKRKNYEK